MKVLVVGLLLAVLLLVGTSIALAGPPEPTVGAHGHHIMLSDGTRGPDVGPDACSNGTSIAFDNFHKKVHRGMPGVKGNSIVVSHGCPLP